MYVYYNMAKVIWKTVCTTAEAIFKCSHLALATCFKRFL